MAVVVARGILIAVAGAFVGVLITRGQGRYQIAVSAEGAALRVDTSTGEVRGCTTKPNLYPVYSCDLSLPNVRRADELAASMPPDAAIAAALKARP